MRRHKVPFNGQRVPFGALVDFMPIPDKQKERAKLDTKTMLGLFVGYFTQPGGIFQGDYLVAELEPFNDNFNVSPYGVTNPPHEGNVREAWRLDISRR